MTQSLTATVTVYQSHFWKMHTRSFFIINNFQNLEHFFFKLAKNTNINPLSELNRVSIIKHIFLSIYYFSLLEIFQTFDKNKMNLNSQLAKASLNFDN